MDIATHTDKIIGVMRRVGSNEAERASGAGEDREEIGSLLELTGLHKRAFAFVRMLDKQEPDKRDDILRSLHPLLNMMDGHWNSQKTPDMFETASTQAGESQADPDDDEKFPRLRSDASSPRSRHCNRHRLRFWRGRGKTSLLDGESRQGELGHSLRPDAPLGRSRDHQIQS